MAVKGLRNQEQDLALQTRGPEATAVVDALAVAGLLTLEPVDRERHWYEFWRRGRDAAATAFEHGGIEAVRALAPPVDVESGKVGCADCWRNGAAAVRRTIEAQHGGTAH